ncbi:MAG: hypothetical protein ABI589_04780 [Burkholderiales bacterium]
MNPNLRNCAVLFAAVAALGLAGCGGSDSPAPAPVPAPSPGPAPGPAPAPVASDPSVGLVKQLVAGGGSETADPLALSGAAFGGSETAEPDPL